MKKKINLKLLSDLYLTFFKLGSVSFGGGYSMIPLIEREAVDEKKWVEKEQIVDIFAVSESLPGSIGLNSSGFIGFYVGGIPGAISALLGNMSPCIIIVLLLSMIFEKVSNNPYVISAFKGIYPVIVGLISYAAYKIGKTALTDLTTIIILALSFTAVFFLKLDPVTVIISGAVLGICISSFKTFMNGKKQLAAEKDGDK